MKYFVGTVVSLCFAGSASALMPVSPAQLSPPCQSILAVQGPSGIEIRVLNAPSDVDCRPFEKFWTFQSPPITDTVLSTYNAEPGAEFLVSGVQNIFGLDFFKRTSEPSFGISTGHLDPILEASKYVTGYVWFDNARGYERSVEMEFLAEEWPDTNPKYTGLYKGKIPEDLPPDQYLLKFGNNSGGPAVAKLVVHTELPETDNSLPELPQTEGELPETPAGGILDENTVIQPEGGNPPIVVGKKPVAAAVDGGATLNKVVPIVYVEKRGKKWAVLSQFGRNRDGVFSVKANLSGTSISRRGACSWDSPDMVQCRAWLTQKGKWRLTWKVDNDKVYARTVVVK